MRNFIVVAVVVLSAILGANQALAFERGGIAESANAVTPLLNGQFAPKTTLKMADGTPVSLQALTLQKPTIVLFYRGGWCPYCSRQLAQLKDIEKEIKKFNELLSEVNKGNINNQIDYNDYNRLNDLLNVQLENWEKNQNNINKIIKKNSPKSIKNNY